MKCPIDNSELKMTERHGIEVDYCPICRGVWLDRGELDKIIERAIPAVSIEEPAPPAREWREPAPAETPREWREPAPATRPRAWREPYRKSGRDDSHGRKRRRKSFLEEIFDFD